MAQEQQQAKVALESVEKGQTEAAEWFSRNGVPMLKISCSASELIPTVQFGNILIGPVTVQRFVPDDDTLMERIQQMQSAVEASVAEERLSTQILMRSNVANAAK